MSSGDRVMAVGNFGPFGANVEFGSNQGCDTFTAIKTPISVRLAWFKVFFIA